MAIDLDYEEGRLLPEWVREAYIQRDQDLVRLWSDDSIIAVTVKWDDLPVARRPLVEGSEPAIYKTIKRDQVYKSVLTQLETRVERLVDNRHGYPMWPSHDLELDAFEREYHGPIRHSYYQETVFLIELLKQLRRVS